VVTSLLVNIYIVTNDVNDLVYIGKTCRTIYERFRDHVKEAHLTDRHHCKFHKALVSIGVSHFKVQLIGRFDASIINDKEIEYIKKYNSYYNGYNSTLGGDGGRLLELDEDIVINDYLNGSSIHDIMRKCGTHSSRTISSILQSNGIHIHGSAPIEIEQYTTDWKYIRTFSSKQEMYEWLIMNYKSDIKRCTAYYYVKKASDTNGVAFGYHWIQTGDDYRNDIDTQKQKFNAVDDSIKMGRPATAVQISNEIETLTFESCRKAVTYILSKRNEIKTYKQIGQLAYQMRKKNTRSYMGYNIKLLE